MMNNNRRPPDRSGNPQNPNGQQRQNPGGAANRGNQPPRGQQPPRQQQNPRPQPPHPQSNQPPQNVRGQNPSAQNPTPMSRINTQNPNRRRSEPKKIKLTAEQIEINRVNRQREKYYIKKHRSAAIRTFISRFMLFLVVLALMSVAVASLFFLNLTRKDSQDQSGYTYKIGDGKAYTLSYGDAVREGRVYVSFTDIAELCNLAVVGSVDDIRYIIKGDETENIRFIVGTRIVYVNTVETRLGGDSYFKDEKLYVPADFVDAYMKGLNVTIDASAHKVTVSREILNQLDEKDNPPKGEELMYGELSFLLQTPSALANIDEGEASAVIGLPDLGFANNLSAYEDYMNPGNSTDYLTLINVTHTLASNFTPQDLIEVKNTRKDGRAQQQMSLYPAKALEALFMELEAAGYTDVSVTSAYRSYSYQEQLFNERLKQFSYLGAGAYAEAAKIVNPPGSSEHQSGLCADFHNLPSADVAFGNTDAFKWIKENCWKFGFILRYPEDKIDITGISYEPWHYRYVGRYHAQQMRELGMCLEEYWAYLGYK